MSESINPFEMQQQFDHVPTSSSCTSLSGVSALAAAGIPFPHPAYG